MTPAREPIDAEVAAWLAERARDPGAADMSVAGRRAYSRIVNAKTLSLLPDLPAARAERDGCVAGVPVRIFTPQADVPAATIVYAHGGGWIAGDLDSHIQHARRLVAGIGATVVSVDYRLAPEHPFPAAFDDCLAVTRWAAAQGPPVAVAGDSAGAQVAASVAIACRDEAIPLAAQLLVVPVVDVRGGYTDAAVNSSYPSRAVNAEGYGLTLAAMAEFAMLYVRSDRAAERDWRVSPLRADLRGVAPAAIHTAGYDPLRDEAAAYASALREAGVAVVHRDWPTLNHGFIGLGGVSPAAEHASQQAVADMRALLGASPDA